MGSLRAYQQRLVDRARESLAAGHKHVLVQSPAGSGKTATMAEIAKTATERGNRVLFIVHRKEIVTQARATFERWGVNMTLCEVGMVQTITRRLDHIETPQLILCDEAHHSLAVTYKRIFEHFDGAALVGFTATPARLSGAGMKEIYDNLIIGPEIKWLIDNNYLAPYDYYAPTLIDVERLKRASTGDYSNKSMDQAIKVRAIFGDVLKTYKEVADETKTIVYTHNVQASIDVAEAFKRAGYPAEQVDGKTSTELREQAMDNFRSGRTLILVNAELYGEGVDVPDCQTVIMLRPTDSLTLFIQQSMRGMRYQPGKRATIIDHVGNAYRFGLPDTPREWSLEGQPKKKHVKSDAPAIRTCPNCFAVLPAIAHICPLCGFEQPVESRELEVEAEAKLTKLTPAFKFTVKRPDHMSPKDAKSMDDLKKIANAHGYKPGWVYYQAKARGFISNKK